MIPRCVRCTTGALVTYPIARFRSCALEPGSTSLPARSYQQDGCREELQWGDQAYIQGSSIAEQWRFLGNTRKIEVENSRTVLRTLSEEVPPGEGRIRGIYGRVVGSASRTVT